MKKKVVHYFVPFVFAVFSLVLYIMLFNPAIPSADFVTAVLVFWAALGCAGIVIFSKEKRHQVVYLYTSAAVIFSLLTTQVFNKFCDYWHVVLVGLVILGFIWLKLFVASHLKYEKKNKH